MSALTFSLVSLSSVFMLHYLKRRSLFSDRSKTPEPIEEFLDWLDPAAGVPRGNMLQPAPTDAAADEGEHSIFRGLASVGLAPTSPRQARVPRKGAQTPEHPATGNDDVADEVVHLRRVSEEEEAERYFSAFSFYS